MTEYTTTDLEKVISEFRKRHPNFAQFEWALADFATTHAPLPNESPSRYLERMLSLLVIH